jgi:hypothetical protein
MEVDAVPDIPRVPVPYVPESNKIDKCWRSLAAGTEKRENSRV